MSSILTKIFHDCTLPTDTNQTHTEQKTAVVIKFNKEMVHSISDSASDRIEGEGLIIKNIGTDINSSFNPVSLNQPLDTNEIHFTVIGLIAVIRRAVDEFALELVDGTQKTRKPIVLQTKWVEILTVNGKTPPDDQWKVIPH